MKKIINTENAPSPIGPYSQAVMAGGMLFISGQVCIDPKTGMLNNSDIETETTQVLDNLMAVLEASGCNAEDVLKTSIFLSDMALFDSVNKIYASYFDERTAPARETVAVKTLPKNVNVEISAIAFSNQ